MPPENSPEGALELGDTLVVEMQDGRKVEYDVVGMAEDEDGKEYRVVYNEPSDEFAVTDAEGNVVENLELAQEILDEFITFANESSQES